MTCNKKAAMLLIVAFSMNSNANVFTGGIPLSETENLAKTSLPINDGNPQALLALAARHGYAKGHFAGPAAEVMRKKFGRSVPVNIEAKRIGQVSGQPDCSHIRLTYKTGANGKDVSQETMDMSVCPNINTFKKGMYK